MLHFLWSLLFGWLILFPTISWADTKPLAIPFTETKHGQAELKIIESIPVLVVQGTAEEIGEQFGAIAVAQNRKLLDQVPSFMKHMGWEKAYPFMLKTAGLMFALFPEDYKKEIEAAAKASKVEKDLIVLANCIADLKKIGGCSTIVAEANRSKTNSPIFGRNLDWPDFEGLAESTLVVIYKPKGKHAFASVTIPPVVGCLSGMNDAGLAVTLNEITKSKDGSARLDVTGTPMLLLYRKILEECTTIDEAEKLLKEAKRTTWCCLTLCDKKSSCVLEMTPKNVCRRNAVSGICCCTNLFLTDELSMMKECWRYDILQKQQTGTEKLGIEDVAKELHKVNQKRNTVQTMIFEPVPLHLHLAYGGRPEPATSKPMKKLALKPLFENGHGK